VPRCWITAASSASFTISWSLAEPVEVNDLQKSIVNDYGPRCHSLPLHTQQIHPKKLTQSLHRTPLKSILLIN
jgi:hypothetical protein